MPVIIDDTETLWVDEDLGTPSVEDADETASVGAAFAAVLSAIATKVAPTADFGTPQFAAESGFFTLDPNTKNLALVSGPGAPGVPPAGFPTTAGAGIDSGLKTADGQTIWLFQGATTDVVIGCVGNDPASAVALVLYLEETRVGDTVTGATLWIAQYAPVQHGQAGVVEGDFRDLANKVFVASEEVVIGVASDFSDVPAGAPNFAMIADDQGGAVQFLVTAFEAAQPNTPITVNVSNQGSFPGSLASGSQNMTPGTGLRFDLVEGGANASDKDVSKIAFDDHAENITQAGFTVVQNQGGRPTDVKIFAYDVGQAEPQDDDGAAFFGSLNQQTKVDIDHVVVSVINPATGIKTVLFDSRQGENAAFMARNADGSVTVKNLQLNWTVEILCDDGLERFTVQNVDSQQNAYIDIGRLTYTTTSVRDSAAEIGSKIQIDDSGPTVSLTGQAAPSLEVDETDLTSDATGDFSGAFSALFGSDGDGGSGLVYTLDCVAGPSGLIDTATGLSVALSKNGAVVEGRAGGQLVFTVSVDANGQVTLNQHRAVVHPTGDPNEAAGLASADLITLTATATDKDDDDASAVLDIADRLSFRDDGPSIALTAAPAPLLEVDETDLSTDASGDFSGSFAADFGSDGEGAAGVTYALSIGAGPTGLVDTATGAAVVLSLVGGVVEGRASGHLVFTVAVDATGQVTLNQLRAVVHPTDDPNEATSPLAPDMIVLTATATDGDDDTGFVALNIGDRLSFRDDGPAVSLSGETAPALEVDESDLSTDASGDFSGLFDHDFGEDGAGSLVFTLGLNAGPTGLVDTATGLPVTLSLVGGTVEGRAGGHLVFTVSVDGSGVVTLDQRRAVVHPTGDPNEAIGLAAADLITLTATATDKDTDHASQVANVADRLSFRDDGPSIDLTGATAPVLLVDESDLSADATAGFSGQFAALFGTDAQGGAGVTYALGIGAGPSGLVDTASGLPVVLSLNGGVVEGRAGTDLVFTVSVAAGGLVTLNQHRAVWHPTADPNETVTLAAASLVTLTATAVDKDGDQDAATLGIGQSLIFADDGPVDIHPAAAKSTNAAGAVGGGALDFSGAVGADQDGRVVFKGVNGSALTGAVGGETKALTCEDDPVYLFGFGTDRLVATTDPTNADASKTVFTVRLDPAGDSWSIEMLRELDNGAALIFNDFSGVPSGQQQWIGLDDPRTGGADQDMDVLFTGLKPGIDTVNTSTTGLGSNNQSVNPTEAIRIDFVSGLNLATGDLKSLATMSFTDHYTVNDAGFTISQTQSGAGVVARVSVFDDDSGKYDLTNDPAEAITGVRVVSITGATLFEGSADGVGVAGSGLTIDFKAGALAVDIKGLTAGMQVMVTTADGFERMLVQNVGNEAAYKINKGFDLGGVVVSDVDAGDPIDLLFDLEVHDEDDDLSGGQIAVTLDPAPLPGALVAGGAAAWGMKAGLLGESDWLLS